MPDLLCHFTTTPSGQANIQCDFAIASEYEQFIQHVKDGVEHQVDIAELMGKPKGTICKWATKALEEGRIRGNKNKLLPPKDNDSPFEEEDE